MKKYPNLTIKVFTILLAVAFLMNGCKKKERSPTDWEELLSAKKNELVNLTANIPCSELEHVQIKDISTDCSVTYYLVVASKLAQFEKLKTAYLDLLSAYNKSLYRAGYIVEPCFESIWMAEQPIRTECKDGKVQLITSNNINIEEAIPLAAKSYEEIMTMVNAQTCTGGAEWWPTPIVKDEVMELDFILYLHSKDYSVLKKKVSLYNKLKYRIFEAQGTGGILRSKLKFDRTDCVNGKPVIVYKN
ncbi:hypothetical protein [Pedobacter heparinus]|uniref:Uncharacterized protein n=1 Tax=Pedobacter heparinus (strain ATCC 13125 / DSM 2366 / CIP 104194 / JCM 7457 / NBRC 12017 / NCIMB 9290 / NRRL B-14731 / HIM 762-3) TaxID=485917 RepID=C6XZB5_PEDHD|nr:hypothetical protein [Pedobacter heparinus]ACU04611.1 hypothetical protein Phep_2407 [Pedobacter heparinus DSM 2366]